MDITKKMHLFYAVFSDGNTAWCGKRDISKDQGTQNRHETTCLRCSKAYDSIPTANEKEE